MAASSPHTTPTTERSSTESALSHPAPTTHHPSRPTATSTSSRSKTAKSPFSKAAPHHQKHLQIIHPSANAPPQRPPSPTTPSTSAPKATYTPSQRNDQ